MIRIIDRLIKAIRSSAVYNPDVQVAPACILWTDRDRQWEAIIPRMQIELPELFVLGEYDIEKRTGPAIWLRCVLAGKISIENETPMENEVKEKPARYRTAENIPVFYVPDVSRQDLRAVESCPDPLKPLAELQYRGVIWSQINGKDWTILSFLKSDQGGLGLDVAQDNNAKTGMKLALYRLLDEDISFLKGKRLDQDYFNTLLTGGDPVRDLLQWLDQGDAFRAGRGESEWIAFVEVCKSQLAFNPQDDGLLSGAEKLAIHEGPWQAIWERYCEAPNRYPNIPAQIGKCTMPLLELFSNAQTHGGWPQWNENQEKDLRKNLCGLSNMPEHEARQQIAELDKSHRERRKLVWVELGQSPLALALRHLTILSEITANSLTAGSVKDLATGYSSTGWKAETAVLQALSFVEKEEDFLAVKTAIRSIYMPWVEDSARYLQKEVDQSGYPGAPTKQKAQSSVNGECIMFVDGLRYDLAQQLSELLTKRGYKVSGKTSWAALPSVTATGKPAVSPVRRFIEGGEADSDFEPLVKKTGQSLKGGYHLKKLLNANGWSVLGKSESGDGKGHAWCEVGNIDHEGHERGWKLSRFITGLLTEISDRAGQLLAAGWKTVRIVTDHGWLLLPGGLPKIDLPAVLVENKWGRCAVIKPGAVTEERLFPWYWNPNQSIVLADGISCFKAGEEYAHGGLSLQECLTLELTVTSGAPPKQKTSAEITDVVWKGLRCKIAVAGDFVALFFDIRIKAGNPDDSVVMNIKPINENGMGSVVVENEELEGNEVSIVLLDMDGMLVAREKTIIGGGTD